MTDPAIEQARARVIASKRWGRTCVTAIMGGFWDQGSLVREATAQIDAEDIRGMKEENQ